MNMFKKVLQLLRISHWSKAAFVFPGVIYSGAMSFLPKALAAAFAFCLLSSAVYIYNDLCDRESDRHHPDKRQRPLVTGSVSQNFAVGALFILLLCSFLLSIWISPVLPFLFIIYIVINLAYNHGLKDIPVLDVLCIASGFMLRVLAGTPGIGLPISWWLTVSATLLSLMIALAKRRLEKQRKFKKITRQVLKKYSMDTLDILIKLTAGGVFLTYTLYAVWERSFSPFFLASLPFAAFGLLRFIRMTEEPVQEDDPVSLFFRDKISCINVFCFLVLTLLAVMQ